MQTALRRQPIIGKPPIAVPGAWTRVPLWGQMGIGAGLRASTLVPEIVDLVKAEQGNSHTGQNVCTVRHYTLPSVHLQLQCGPQISGQRKGQLLLGMGLMGRVPLL